MYKFCIFLWGWKSLDYDIDLSLCPYLIFQASNPSEVWWNLEDSHTTYAFSNITRLHAKLLCRRSCLSGTGCNFMGLSQRSRWTNTFTFKQCPSPPPRIFLILIKSYWCHKNVVLSVITPPTFFMSLLVGALHGKLGHALWWGKGIVSSLTWNYRFCIKMLPLLL